MAAVISLAARAARARGITIPKPALDEAGEPFRQCGTCGGLTFHLSPRGEWTCSGCEPPVLPEDATGWAFCAVVPAAQEQSP